MGLEEHGLSCYLKVNQQILASSNMFETLLHACRSHDLAHRLYNLPEILKYLLASGAPTVVLASTWGESEVETG